MQDIVLCKIYRKATSLKVLEQRAAMEEEMKNFHASPSSPPTSSLETGSFYSTQQEDHQLLQPTPAPVHTIVFKKEAEEVLGLQEKMDERGVETKVCPTSLQIPHGRGQLPELQVPKLTMDWTQDPFWTQLNSPWLQNLTPYANILNFWFLHVCYAQDTINLGSVDKFCRSAPAGLRKFLLTVSLGGWPWLLFHPHQVFAVLFSLFFLSRVMLFRSCNLVNGLLLCFKNIGSPWRITFWTWKLLLHRLTF